jgi:hypothetical protein
MQILHILTFFYYAVQKNLKKWCFCYFGLLLLTLFFNKKPAFFGQISNNLINRFIMLSKSCQISFLSFLYSKLKSSLAAKGALPKRQVTNYKPSLYQKAWPGSQLLHSCVKFATQISPLLNYPSVCFSAVFCFHFPTFERALYN